MVLLLITVKPLLIALLLLLTALTLLLTVAGIVEIPLVALSRCRVALTLLFAAPAVVLLLMLLR